MHLTVTLRVGMMSFHVQSMWNILTLFSCGEASKLDAVYGLLAMFNVQTTRDQVSNLK